MNIRLPFVCGTLVAFATLAYGGSYQRTRDGQTLVWRDVPARGDEATWSGKRDKDGFATGSGVLTWYKVEPTIVTGSNIMDTRRYVMMINHYSGTMVRGKFKGAVSNLESNGRRPQSTSVEEANRRTRRPKTTRTAGARVRSTPSVEPSPTPFTQPIVVEHPEGTSAVSAATPTPEQNSSAGSEQSEPDMAEETGSVGAKPMATPAEQSTGQTPSQIAQQPESAARAETGTLVARHVAPPTSDQHGDDRTGSVPETPQSNNSNEQRSAPPFELPKPPPSVDTETVARLDAVYQSAVKANDAAIMDEILADDFVGLTDRGASLTKADLIKEAQGKRTLYEHQEVEEGTQKVRIWRDTAVVTALLRISGTRDKNPFDYKMWVSETYVRTPTGWRYVFGQPLKPDTP